MHVHSDGCASPCGEEGIAQHREMALTTDDRAGADDHASARRVPGLGCPHPVEHRSVIGPAARCARHQIDAQLDQVARQGWV